MSTSLSIVKLFLIFLLLNGMSFWQSNGEHSNLTALPNIAENCPPRVDELSQELIALYSKMNSCYLPLLKDPALYGTGSKVGFEWSELFNDSLAKESQYKNRYLVGDFMALNEELESRGIEEKNPSLKNLIDFKK